MNEIEFLSSLDEEENRRKINYDMLDIRDRLEIHKI